MDVDGINVEQELKIVEGNTAGRKDVVQIKYHVTNQNIQMLIVRRRLNIGAMLSKGLVKLYVI